MNQTNETNDFRGGDEMGDRQRTEAALRESERRFREMIDALPAAIYTTDDKGRLTHFNRAAVEFSGRAPELGSDDWCMSWKLYNSDGTPMPHDECPMAIALMEGRVLRGEEVIAERPDGTRVWFTPYPTPLRDAEGKIVGGINMLVDITERKRTEEALRLSEEQYRSLFESIDEGFCVIEVLLDESGAPHDYRFVQANPAFERLTGLDHAIGKTARELVPNLEQFWVDTYGKVALTGEAARFENHSEAMNRWFDVYASRVGGDGSRFVAIVFNNVTERKVVERRSEFLSRLSHKLASQSDPLEINRLATREIGEFLSVHRCYFFDVKAGGAEAEVLPGWQRDGGPPFIGAYRLAKFGRPEWWQAAQRGPVGVADVRTHPWTEQFSSNYPPIDILAYAVAPFVHEGRWIASVGVSSNVPRHWTADDLTLLEHAAARVWPLIERARVGQALQQLNRELERRVVARTQALQHSEDRLRALATELNLTEQRERKRLATELHDHLAQMMVLGQLTLSQAKRLAGVPSACADLIAKTQDVLTESLAYTRTLVADLAPPVLHDLGLPVALKWLGERMQRYKLRVAVELPDGERLPLSEDRAVLLFQSVRELLINASKHADSAEASVRLERRNGDLHITVQDYGKGFDLAAATTAGAGHATLSSRFGLFSIRERMRALGGSFGLDSAPGRGTTATLTLPLVQARGQGREASGAEIESTASIHRFSASEPLAPSPSPLASARIRVLLVDDHAMVRQGLRSVLESYNDVEVVGEAGDGEEALALAERWRPAVIVMDINMPRKNGIEATAEITARYPDTIVIGLSVNSGGVNTHAMIQAGAAMLLTKDAAVDQLYRAIQEALHRNMAGGE